MNCALCSKQIENYNPAFHHLKIDDERGADICKECSSKFLKWQRGILAGLFPTRAAKRIFGEKQTK